MGNTPVTTYPPYQASTFATSQMPQYAGYTPAYAQPPSFTSPYQPPTSHGIPHSQAQNQPQTPYATMPNAQHHYGSADAQSQDHGSNNDSSGVTVPPPY